MTGIRVGSKLDQLLEPRRRVDAEIRVEQRIEAARAKRRKQAQKSLRRYSPRANPGPNHVDQILADHGVTARQVKEWALATGLITEIKRGRIGCALATAYARAHSTTNTSTGDTE